MADQEEGLINACLIGPFACMMQVCGAHQLAQDVRGHIRPAHPAVAESHARLRGAAPPCTASPLHALQASEAPHDRTRGL